MHYVYPYPHVRELVPLMADGLVLPYLDIPFQHAHPDTLKRMARPAAAARTLDEIAAWRDDTALTRAHVKAVAPMALRHRLRRDPLDEAGSGTRVARTMEEVLG